MHKSEEMPFGYGRMALDRAGYIRESIYWMQGALYLDNKIPLPFREYSALSQFTDSLRFDSTAEMSRMLILAKCIYDMERDLDEKCRTFDRMAEEVYKKTGVVVKTHTRESGKAWRDEYDR